jgi:mRNA-degrading endonuclease toxin of MazEF toxin-antitoxin module
MVRQGEIYDYDVAGARYRVLIVSADAHNEVRTPWVVPLRRGKLSAPPYLVPLVDADPVGGTADIDRLDRAPVSGESVGIISGATMERIREAIHTLFAI